MQHIAGVDEAGRGPLAGPVIASAVILDPAHPIEGLRDSKKLTAKRRVYLASLIEEHALAYAIGRAEVEEIDTLNILQASLLAMKRAVAQLSILPHKALVDGNQCPDLDCAVEAIIQGDQTVAAISAASILAKVYRDEEMLNFDKQYPQYGFAQHKGYPTKQHVQALEQHGVSPIHRRSFGPVKRLLVGVA